MPKFLVTSSSHFTPFTYDELAKPLMQMQEAHNATQDAYDTLSMQTEALREYISENEDDAEARRLYKAYTDKLSTLQNNLWEHGFTGQTRRDLAAARTAFSSNITPVAKAIQNRIERSKEYWDAKHKNPELIQGIDPGTEGLDKYLHDENYGRNWFSYNGRDFENEVGAEVKSRAAALLDDISQGKVVANPNLPQTLTRIINHGVTNEEINFASQIVDKMVDLTPEQRTAFYQQANLPDGVQILTESLLSRYDATGIRSGNVSAEARQSLLNRGKAGWAQGVFEPNVKDFENPAFELEMYQRKANIDYNNYARKKALDTPKPTETEGGWSYRPTWEQFRSPDAVKNEAALHEQFHSRYTDANGQTVPKRILGHDGVEHWVSDATEAARYAYDTEARKMGLDPEFYGGFDVSLSVGKRDWKNQVSKDGSRIAVKDGGKIVIKNYNNGNIGAIDQEATDAYNRLMAVHKAEMDNFEKNNPEFNLRKDTFSADDARALRRKYEGRLDLSNVPDDELELAIQRATVKDMMMQAAPLFDSRTANFDDVRKDFAAALDDFLAGSGDTGKNGKSSIFMAYPVAEGGYEMTKEGKTKDEAFVMDTDKNGNSRIDPKCIISAKVLPEDVAVGMNGEPMIRVKVAKNNPTSKNKGRLRTETTDYLISARAFGNLYNNLTASVEDPTTGKLTTGQEIFKWLTQPYLHPDVMLGLDDDSSALWASRAEDLLNDRGIPSAKSIVRNDGYWNSYYAYLIELLKSMNAKEIDWSTFTGRQHPGATNAKAAGYRGTQK